MTSNSDHLPLGEDTAHAPLSTLIAVRAAAAPDAPAIFAEGAPPLSNQSLQLLAQRVEAALQTAGLGAQDRVALTAPPGPEFAAAATTIAASAICAPLNPNLAKDTWAEMLSHLRIDALVAPPDCKAARSAARALGLVVLDLHPRPETGAGAFDLEENTSAIPKGKERPSPGLDDIAFILPTSGTTSYPKAVQLTHRNISHSGRNTGASLALTANDRLMGVLPIHHAHGLISGLMATLHAGASIIMMRGFAAAPFFDQVARFQPTWLTAVPAIHNAILDAAPDHLEALKNHKLRLVRSASAPLPEAAFRALSDLFDVPVIETYGMTEAASQIASNPLGRGLQKPGSVGVAAGPEIAILNDEGAMLPPGEVGEVALRGPNVFRGYDDPDATAAAFTPDRWFRTGDLGHLDEEGYLFLVGRLKEVINRGGEKILPQRVEKVLTGHPMIAEAAVFAAPHDRLGEDVAAAVVAVGGAKLDEADIRAFAHASGKLSDAETPRLVIAVDELPKTITGKVQRALLAGHLGLKEDATLRPDTADEKALIAIWRDVMKVEDISANSDFFRLGGDSLMAAEIMLRISEDFDVDLSLRALFEAPTPRALAAALDSAGRDRTDFQITKLPIGAKPRPVSFSQERILALEAAMPGLPTHTVPITYAIEGPLDPFVLEEALRTLISRHDALRSTFRKIDGVWKAIPAATGQVDLPPEDWRWAAKISNDKKLIDEMLESEVWDVLDPTKSKPVRVRLLKVSDNRHVLVLIFHHIAIDNWSIRLCVEELFQHYRDLLGGGALSRPRPALQFADFAAWQRRWADGTEAARQNRYWLDQLNGARPVIPTNDGQASIGFGVDRAEVYIPRDDANKLSSKSQAVGATLFMGLVAALKVFLFRRFDQSDIVITAPAANRLRPATGDVLGLIANNVALRTNAAAQGFGATLAAVRNAVLNANANQELPFETVMAGMAATDPVAADALTEIYVSLADRFELEVSDPALKISQLAHEQALETPLPIGASKLMMFLSVQDGAITGSFVFKSAKQNGEDISAMMEEFVERLPELIADGEAANVV